MPPVFHPASGATITSCSKRAQTRTGLSGTVFPWLFSPAARFGPGYWSQQACSA
ncbi:hypothetical protein AmDm5_0826 [Acetobacter malorum]|nr:hypothetical protein AmDm5_0826 [Acetobacter malorum]